MGDVAALPGYSIPNNHAPVDRVVEILEEALTLARQGEMIGVCVTAVYRQPLAFGIDYHGEYANRHTLAAGVMQAQYKLAKAIDESN